MEFFFLVVAVILFLLVAISNIVFLSTIVVSYLAGTLYLGISRKQIRAVLKFGELSQNDTFCDLGSGDGRVLVSAVKNFGVKRAVGFEVAPWPCFVSRIWTWREGLGKSIVIYSKNFLSANISAASFIYVYLDHAFLNKTVLPKLAGQIKVGTKVLSCSNMLDTAHYHQFRLLKTKKLGYINVYLYEKTSA